MGEAQIRGNQVNDDLLFSHPKIKVKSCRAWFTLRRLSIDPNGIMVSKNIAYFFTGAMPQLSQKTFFIFLSAVA